MNAGQVCLSVNHVFADPEIVDQLIDRMKFWNDQYQTKGNEHMARVINERNFDRLTGLREKTKGKIVYGGGRDRKERYIQPTVVLGATGSETTESFMSTDSLMSEELFGPILPVLPASVDEALAYINKMPEPLGLYIFTADNKVAESIMDRTISGGVTINNVMMHAALNAPFGGVGESGHGAYHGVSGVDAFSHRRAVVQPPAFLDKLSGFTYTPYDEKNIKNFVIKNLGDPGTRRGACLEGARGAWRRRRRDGVPGRTAADEVVHWE